MVITDHVSLLSLRRPQKEFKNDRLARWAVELDQYDLVIAHRPGKYLYMPDILSRAPMETDEKEIDRIVQQSWGRTAALLMEYPQWREQMYREGAQQQRLTAHVRAAVVPAQRGRDEMTVMEAVQAIEAEEYDAVTPEVEESEELLVYDMYEMACNAVEQMGREDECCEPTYDQFEEDEAIRSKLTQVVNELDQIQIVTKSKIGEAQKADRFCQQMIKYLESGGEETPKTAKESNVVVRNAHAYGVQESLLVAISKSRHAKWSARVQLYVPAGHMRTQIVEQFHSDLGHSGVLRTYQHLQSTVYWPGMWRDTSERVTACAQCQFYAQRESKAAVQGHIRADACGQKYAMDIMHMSEEDGNPKLAAAKRLLEKAAKQAKSKFRDEEAKYEYALTVIDVFSRYGFLVPLKDIEAETIAEALRSKVLYRGLAEEFIFDGGAEFKAEVRAGARAYNSKVHQTCPMHSKSLGIGERYNRTIQEKMAHFTEKTEQPFTKVYGEVLWAYNGAVSEALSYQGEPITPAEVWFGEKLRMPTAELLKVEAEDKKQANPASYFSRVKALLKLVEESVSESREKYFANMEAKARGDKKSKPAALRMFKVGDEVTRYRPTRSKRVNKLAPLQEGPFVVTEALENGVSYRIKRSGSDELEVKVHVDDINSFKRWNAEGPSQMEAEISDKEEGHESAKQKFQVAKVMDERGKGTKQHEYLMQWDGQQEDGTSWKCTWCHEKDLDCHLLIMDWEMANAQERGKRRKEAKLSEGPQGGVCAVCEIKRDNGTKIKPVQVDILELVMEQERSGRTVIQQLCDKLDILMEEILIVWASPPCETFTKLDATNVFRGNEHRNHETESKEPRTIESCHSEADFAKRTKAINDDRMVAGLNAGFLKDNRDGRMYEYAEENPQGMLAERPYMQSAEWVRAVLRQLVHYCNYGGQFHKPTHIWTSLKQWVAGGRSGCGQCCQNCEAGRWKWVEKSIRTTGIQYVHDKQIGGPNEKRGTEKGSQKEQRWKVPVDLLEEIVEQAEVGCDHKKKKYIIDLFAGQGSMKDIAKKRGYVYVPVDIDLSRI